MSSEFLRHPSKRSKKAVLSYAWYEELDRLARAEPGQMLAVWIAKAHKSIYHRMPGIREVDAIVKRLNEEASQSQELENNSKQRPPIKNVFGASHTEWLQTFSPQKSCLILADFDLDKARRLYNDIDKKVVDWMIAEKTELMWHGYFQNFEAVMFGFGNNYQGAKSGPVNEVDLNEEDPSPALMRSLGLAMH